jgi:hypothetical protein
MTILDFACARPASQRTVGRELNDELVSHLEMHMADNRRSGMSPEVARRNEVLRLDGVEQTKGSCRERRRDMCLPGRSFPASCDFSTKNISAASQPET